jgi:hypothetical protein
MAIMPTSTIHGPITDYDQLISAEFKIKLVAEEDIVTCKQNQLIVYEETEKYDEKRDTSTFTYEIVEKDDTVEKLRVPAKTVFSSVDGCAVETIVEWKNPETNEWEVVRQTPRSAMNFS